MNYKIGRHKGLYQSRPEPSPHVQLSLPFP
jgi:hypothetical protein